MHSMYALEFFLKTDASGAGLVDYKPISRQKWQVWRVTLRLELLVKRSLTP